MRYIKISVITSLFLFLSSCSYLGENTEYDLKLTDEFFSNPTKVKAGESVVVGGLLDTKSICLNINDKTIAKEKFCQGYLSETGSVNSRAVAVELTICTNEIKNNCLERLTNNTPPEDVVIRSQSGRRVFDTSINRVILRAKTGKPAPLFEVVQIN